MVLNNEKHNQRALTTNVQKMIDEDVKKIDVAIESDDLELIRETHINIDGTYQACIKNWMMGMYAFHPEHGFIYDNLDIESMRDNLRIMKPKLLAYKNGLNVLYSDATERTDVNVVVNTHINLEISFNEARQKIEDMPGLTFDETEDIKRRINELQEIANEKTTNKRKWERIKPILVFALDKGVDVAITIMSLILQMKLGTC